MLITVGAPFVPPWNKQSLTIKITLTFCQTTLGSAKKKKGRGEKRMPHHLRKRYFGGLNIIFPLNSNQQT